MISISCNKHKDVPIFLFGVKFNVFKSGMIKVILNHNKYNMVWESTRLINLCQLAPNLNHKWKLLLDIKCYENHNIYIFQNP